MSQRRTARITKPVTATTAPAVAAPKSRQPYEPTAVSRVYDKATGVCLGYLVPAAAQDHPNYQVTCDRQGAWHCTCSTPQGIECDHVKAVKQICELRVKAGKPGCFQGQAKELDAPTKESAKVIAFPVARETQDAKRDAREARAEMAKQERRRTFEEITERANLGGRNAFVLPSRQR